MSGYYQGTSKVLKYGAKLEDTLDGIRRIAERDTYQVTELAHRLRADTVEETCRNIWHYLRANTRYRLDDEGREQLRTPAATLHEGRLGLVVDGYGVDCDDYTIIISSLLRVLGIGHEYNVVGYSGEGRFEHIYPVAFDGQGNRFVIDVVPEIPYFGYEEGPVTDRVTVTVLTGEQTNNESMILEELSGIGNAGTDVFNSELNSELIDGMTEPFDLGGIHDEDGDDDDLSDSGFLQGIEEVDSEEEADLVLSGADIGDMVERGLLAELNKARTILVDEKERPTGLDRVIDVGMELGLIVSVMDSWGDKGGRRDALATAIAQSRDYTNFFRSVLAGLDGIEVEVLNGVHDGGNIYFAKIGISGHGDGHDDEMDDLSGRRRRRRRRKGRLRKFFKKIGKGVKKAVKAVVRFNPATITVRAAIRTVMRTNMFGFSEKIIYGYLSEQQARDMDLDLDDWRRTVDARTKAEKFYMKLGGRADKFRHSVIRSKGARGKTGVQLGEVTAAGTAAAGPFILFMKKLLDKVNPVRIVKSISRKVKAKKEARREAERLAEEEADSVQINAHRPADAIGADSGAATDGTGHDDGKTGGRGFTDRLKSVWKAHWKKFAWGGSVSVVVIVIGFYAAKKHKEKKKRSLAGVKAARTRRKNRKAQLNGTRPVRAIGKAPTKTGALAGRPVGKGNGNRLREMHAKAKILRKKYPGTKYSALLKQAAKTMK